MRRSGVIINGRLIELITALGHTQSLVIADAGLPVPPGVECIDLAVRAGLPGFLDLLDVVLAEMEVESVVLASEIQDRNPKIHMDLLRRLGDRGSVTYVSHDEFKEHSRRARAIVRTGEFSPYANIELVAGVAF